MLMFSALISGERNVPILKSPSTRKYVSCTCEIIIMWKSKHRELRALTSLRKSVIFGKAAAPILEHGQCSLTEHPFSGLCEEPLTRSQKMLLSRTARILLKESVSRSQILLCSDQFLGWKCLLQLKNLEIVAPLSSITFSVNSIITYYAWKKQFASHLYLTDLLAL